MTEGSISNGALGDDGIETDRPQGQIDDDGDRKIRRGFTSDSKRVGFKD